MTKGISEEPKAANFLKRVYALQAEGKLSEAAELCQNFVDAEQPTPDALHLLGTLLYQSGSAQDAISRIEQAIELQPNNADFYSDLALCLRSQGKRLEALAALEKAIELDEHHLAAHYNLGEEYANVGRFDDGLKSTLEVIKQRPKFVNAWINAGICLKEKGALKEAKQYFEEAVELSPESPVSYFALGEIELELGNEGAAIPLFQSAMQYGYDKKACLESLVEACKAKGEWEAARIALLALKEMGVTESSLFQNLALIEEHLGNVDEAVKAYKEALSLNPQDCVVMCSYSDLCRRTGKLDEAVDLAEKSYELNSSDEKLLNNLGNCYRAQGAWGKAIKAYEKGIVLKGSEESVLQGNLAVVLRKTKDSDGARNAFEVALQLDPLNVSALINYAIFLAAEGELGLAFTNLERALELDADNVGAILAYGKALGDGGDHENADGMLRLSVKLDPSFDFAWVNLAALQNYREISSEEIVETHREAAQAIAQSCSLSPEIVINPNQLDPNKRLKIGILSGDLRGHSVAYFLRPLFEQLEREKFEVVCYSTAEKEDSFSKIFQGFADKWNYVYSESDEFLVERIRSDEVDILLDLSGYSAAGRPRVLSMRAAPLQLSWLGYPNSTEIENIDYRIGDEITDAFVPSSSREKLYKLPGCFICYSRFDEGPIVAPLPARKNGYITFGSFNNSKKISDGCLELWASVLKNVENSRLVLKSAQFADASIRSRVLTAMEKKGIVTSRLDLLGRIKTSVDHLDAYNRIDIALDTIPYNGTTTTCEALWMGVPVLTLEGDRHVSRVGASLMSAVGLEDWVAESSEHFVANAWEKAKNLETLEGVRLGLRDRMKASELMDSPGFASKFGDALRDIWVRYCSDEA
ncbi:tetratricopeptide repeat protein [Puniceicoccaceae bacterium K14]|nr:tetratricopeptide repeat protein [Puniceicoccaceae bacterium K14]